MSEQKSRLPLFLGGLTALYFLLTKKGGNFKTQAIEAANGHAAIIAQEEHWPKDAILTQAMHESDWLRSGLTKAANNLFGFKADKSWIAVGKPYVTMPTSEFIGGKWVKVDANFRKYGSYTESMRDWARLMKTLSRYAAARAALDRKDSPAFFKAIGTSGYATDPNYGGKLAGVFEQVQSLVV